MSKAVILPLVALGCLLPLVSANLAQEIAQSSEEEVADTIDTVDGYTYDIELPQFDDLPGDTGAVVLAQAVGPAGAPTAAPLPPPPDAFPDVLPTVENPFTETRLGQALSQTPAGVDPVERTAQSIIGFWHQLILDLQLADYSRTLANGQEDTIIEPENPGPCYASRAMAMAHLAMYDAYVGVTGDDGTYLTYSPAELPTGVPADIQQIAAAAAAGSACALVLTHLYENPDDRAAINASRTTFEAVLTNEFGGIIPFVDEDAPWPNTVANKIIADRRNDGSGNPDQLAFLTFQQVNRGSSETYEHVPDPIAVDPESGEAQFFYAPHWGLVRPFMHSKPSLPGLRKDFRQEGPLNNYLADFQEVLDVGRNVSTTRTDDQTRTGLFWAYDGGYRIGVPPRLYNSITDDVIIDLLGKSSPSLATGFQLMRLYAMVNVALADAGISAWKDKYFFNFWRPIIGIRRADEDPSTASLQDTEWVPLGAPNTNRDRPGINPAFPAYPSGHATFGTAVLEIVKQVLNTGASKFTMYSDEFSGTAVDDVYCGTFPDCVIDEDNPISPKLKNKRPNLQRTLSIDEAIEENKQSRIYLGVHWQGDQTAGVLLGERIAENIVANFPGRA